MSVLKIKDALGNWIKILTIKGDKGDTGNQGAQGIPGVSPTVTVTDITGGHRVTITDADHPGGISFDVPNGSPGEGVPTGGTTGQILKKSSGTDYDTEWGEVPVKGVTVNGTSVVNAQGNAEMPIATQTSGVTASSTGMVYCRNGYDGVRISQTNPGRIELNPTQPNQIKAGSDGYLAVPTARQHESAFYGLSKVAGVDLANETVTVGTYPEASKSAIQKMLGAVGANDIAYIETTLVAQHSYVQGEYFVDADGMLSKATAAINTGTVLDLGTNYDHVNEDGGFANDMLAPATLVGSKTLTAEDFPLTANTVSVPLSKPCRHLVVMIRNNGSVLPGWSYLRLNNKASSPCLQVRASGGNQLYAYCLIDLVNKYGIALLKASTDQYANTIAASFSGDNNNLMATKVATEVGLCAVSGDGFQEGLEIKVYGR